MPSRFIRYVGQRTHPIMRERILQLTYRATGDLRLMVARADDLVRLGRTREALAAYRAVLEALRDNPQTADRQALQFASAHGLHRLGVDEVADPLFSVRFDPSHAQPRAARWALAGRYTVKLTYMGLRVAGRVNQAAVKRAGVTAVEVRVGESVIRRINLGRGSRASTFSLLIRRPALASFPTRATLSVRSLASDARPGPPLLIGSSAFVVCGVPFGDGSVEQRTRSGPLVDKKGRLRRTMAELDEQHDAFLGLYARAAKAFDALFERPLFLMYGTLLGLHRDGDFIPGDDDFDVGYVSRQASTEAVKAEVLDIMRRLVREGFEVSVNRKGKPFRLREPNGRIDLHLDARPVWYQDGRVWAHKQASLDLPFDTFTCVRRVPFRSVEAVVPGGTEAFLEAYYGTGWRVPDPAYSNEAMGVPDGVKATLDRLCLDARDIARLRQELEKEPDGGRFFTVADHDLYPLDAFERRVGW